MIEVIGRGRNRQVREVGPIEDLCVHCIYEANCSYDANYQIMSDNPQSEESFLVECSGFKTSDGILEVKVEEIEDDF